MSLASPRGYSKDYNRFRVAIFWGQKGHTGHTEGHTLGAKRAHERAQMAHFGVNGAHGRAHQTAHVKCTFSGAKRAHVRGTKGIPKKFVPRKRVPYVP